MRIFGGALGRRIGRIDADHPVEQHRRIAHAARHRAGRVLAVADRHDVRPADHAERRFQTDQPVHRGRTHHRSIGLGPDRCRGKARRHRRARSARGSARGPVERVRIAHQPADRAPSAHRVRRADIGPFAEVGLAEDHRALPAQARHQRRVAARDVVLEREAPGGRRDRIPGLNIVLDQHRHAVERPERLACLAPRIGSARLRDRIGVGRDHRAERRPGPVHRRDPREIGLGDRRAARARRHHRLDLIDRFFGNVRERLRVRGSGENGRKQQRQREAHLGLRSSDAARPAPSRDHGSSPHRRQADRHWHEHNREARPPPTPDMKRGCRCPFRGHRQPPDMVSGRKLQLGGPCVPQSLDDRWR